MSALKIIRTLFTARFQNEMGDVWESTQENILTEARKQGGRALVGAWLDLVLDTAWRAPVMHAEHLMEQIRGPKLVLAGLGPGAAFFAASKHWLWRPAADLWLWTASYLGLIFLGVFLGLMTDAGLTFAADPETELAVLHPFKVPLGVVLALIAATILGDRWLKSWRGCDRSLIARLAFIGGGWFCAILFVFVWDGGIRSALFEWRNFQVPLVVIGALTATAIWTGRWLGAWHERGRPVLAPLIFMGAGWLGSLLFVFVGDANSRQMDDGFGEDYISWLETPVTRPWQNADEKLTDAQQVWFQLTPARANGHDQIWEIRPEKREAWCAEKTKGLMRFQQKLSSNSGANYSAGWVGLWGSMLRVSTFDGCIDGAENALRLESRFSQRMNASPSDLETKWRWMTGFAPLVDEELSVRYDVGRNNLPDPFDYCSLMISRKSIQNNAAFDHSKMIDFCFATAREWSALNGSDSGSASDPGGFSLFQSKTSDLENQLNRARVFNRADLLWLDEKIEANWGAIERNNGGESTGIGGRPARSIS